MYLVTYFVTNFVSFSVRKYSHFSSPYLVMYLVIYFVTFLVKSHVLLYWRSIIEATKYRTYLDCLLMQFYGDFKSNLALVVSSLIINISCPAFSFGADCPSLTILSWRYLKTLFSQSKISWGQDKKCYEKCPSLTKLLPNCKSSSYTRVSSGESNGSCCTCK